MFLKDGVIDYQSLLPFFFFFFFDEEMHNYYFSTIGPYYSALIDHLHKVHNAPWLRASMLDAWAKSTMQLR